MTKILSKAPYLATAALRNSTIRPSELMEAMFLLRMKICNLLLGNGTHFDTDFTRIFGKISEFKDESGEEVLGEKGAKIKDQEVGSGLKRILSALPQGETWTLYSIRKPENRRICDRLYRWGRELKSLEAAIKKALGEEADTFLARNPFELKKKKSEPRSGNGAI